MSASDELAAKLNRRQGLNDALDNGQEVINCLFYGRSFDIAFCGKMS